MDSPLSCSAWSYVIVIHHYCKFFKSVYWTENVWPNQLVLTKTDINACGLETEDSNIAALQVYVKHVICSGWAKEQNLVRLP